MKKRYLYITLLVLTLGILCYGGYFAYSTHQKLTETERAYGISTSTLENKINKLESSLANVLKENEGLNGVLSEEQKKTLSLEREKEKNEDKIDTLTKLTTIDPELLKKYSKVFFLSENYSPPDLETINPNYLINKDKPLEFLDDALPFLEDLLEDAEDDGIDLKVVSAYRSFGTQSSLKANYTFTYGAGTANRFSADQGYSEHQLGTTVDFTTSSIKGAYLSFEHSPAYSWLLKNAYKYGFVISYPKGNAYYMYEPWHWRFVGTDLARDLHKDGKNFYDLDQRSIDEYLIKIFD